MSGFDENPVHCADCKTAGSICEGHQVSDITGHASSIMTESFSASDLGIEHRISHSVGVCLRSIDYSGFSDDDEGQHLRHFRSALAFLHDIGYAHPDSGVHALDGARFIRDRHPELAFLAPFIAWHSNAAHEYQSRGYDLSEIDREFPLPTGGQSKIELALLWVSDFTSSSVGDRVSVNERFDGIRSRYEMYSPVILALDSSLADFERAVGLVESTFLTNVPR